MPEFVHSSVTDRVARVFLSRPDLHNAFDEVVIDELTKAFEEAGKRDDVQVVVLCADGKSFCAGADIAWMQKMVNYSFDENVADALTMARMLRAIRECPRPVIARVHGAAYGGGVGLIAACDLAVAVASATFCLSEVKLGIIPAVISPFVLEKIGPGHFRRYALTAERFSADEAARIGLVSEAVASIDKLDEWIGHRTALLTQCGPAALAACKRTMSEVVGLPWDDVQQMTARRIAELRASPEGQEGLRAFFEKRKPKWAED